MHNGTPHERDESSGSRALVPLGSPAPASTAAGRPLAGFVTQLIACERRLSLFRARARAEPRAATGCYAATDAPAPAPRARVDRRF